MFFKGMKFDEKTHTYSINGRKFSGSVSSKVNMFREPFESKKISEEKGLKSGLPLDYFSKRWKTFGDEACAIGDRAHHFAEYYPDYRDILKPESGMEEAIVKFFNDLPDHIVVVQSELMMYHKEFMFPGTADLLLYNTKTGEFYICDWKTNKDLFKVYTYFDTEIGAYTNKKLIKPFDNLDDNPFNGYQLQFSFYQILFEQTGYKVAGRKLIHIKDDGNYIMYETEDFTKVLLHELKQGKLVA